MTINLKFLTYNKYISSIPEIYPSANFMPDWYKGMSLKSIGRKPSYIQNVSVKACPGISSCLKTGYIVPAWCDFFIDVTDTPYFESSLGTNFVTPFPNEIVKNLPFRDGHESFILKFNSPWKLVSDKKFPLLVTSPFFNFIEKCQVYDGIIDVGSHISDIHFIVSVKNKITEWKRGEPLLQLVPLSPENFKSSICEYDDYWERKNQKQLSLVKSYAFGGYFKNFFRKRTYK